MRTALAVLLLAIPLAARADDAAKDLLNKALAAQGSPEKSADLANIAVKGKAKASENGMTAEITFEFLARGLDSARAELSISADGRMEMTTLVIAGDMMWARNVGVNETTEAPEEVRPAIRAFLAAIRAPGMLGAFAKLPGVTVTHGGEAMVGETAVELLRFSRTDRPDVTVFLDKRTGLPVKCESLIKEPGGEEQTFAFHVSDFKEVAGVKHFHKIKIIRGDKELAELELTHLKPGATFEANAFDKP